jgi:putative transcriptional regulator
MSDILKSIHRTATGLHKSDAIDDTEMAKFNSLCSTDLHEFTSAQVKALREKNKLTKKSFAEILNVSDSSVSRWEQGKCKPRGAALKILALLEKKGLESVI